MLEKVGKWNICPGFTVQLILHFNWQNTFLDKELQGRDFCHINKDVSFVEGFEIKREQRFRGKMFFLTDRVITSKRKNKTKQKKNSYAINCCQLSSNSQYVLQIHLL